MKILIPVLYWKSFACSTISVEQIFHIGNIFEEIRGQIKGICSNFAHYFARLWLGHQKFLRDSNQQRLQSYNFRSKKKKNFFFFFFFLLDSEISVPPFEWFSNFRGLGRPPPRGWDGFENFDGKSKSPPTKVYSQFGLHCNNKPIGSTINLFNRLSP